MCVAVFPSCCLARGQTMVGVMTVMEISLKRIYDCTVVFSVLTPQQATVDPHLRWRLLDRHRQVWLSLLWGYCSFLPASGAHKVLFVPSKSLFPQSYVSSDGSVAGLMATSSKRAFAIPSSAAPRTPAPVAGQCSPIPPQETRAVCEVK